MTNPTKDQIERAAKEVRDHIEGVGLLQSKFVAEATLKASGMCEELEKAKEALRGVIDNTEDNNFGELYLAVQQTLEELEKDDE